MLSFKHILMDLLATDGGAGGGGAANAAATAGNGDTTGAGATGNNAAAAGGVSWDSIKATISDEYKNDPTLATIKDVNSLVKGYVHSQRMVGKASIPIPDAKHATQEDYVTIMRKLGAPDKIEDFKIKMPDGVKEEAMDQGFLKTIKETAIKAGVLPWQFEQIFGEYHKFADGAVKKSESEYKTQQTTDVNSLKIEWGQAFDTQVKKANVALKELLPNEADRVRLVEDGLGSHPSVLKLLAASAKFFKEDTFLGHGEGALANVTPKDALHKAQLIQGDAAHPYRNPTHPNHAAAKKEVMDLYKIAYPE